MCKLENTQILTGVLYDVSLSCHFLNQIYIDFKNVVQ